MIGNVGFDVVGDVVGVGLPNGFDVIGEVVGFRVGFDVIGDVVDVVLCVLTIRGGPSWLSTSK